MDTRDIEEVALESTPSFMREPPIADVPPTQHLNEMVGWQNELPSVSFFYYFEVLPLFRQI